MYAFKEELTGSNSFSFYSKSTKNLSMRQSQVWGTIKNNRVNVWFLFCFHIFSCIFVRFQRKLAFFRWVFSSCSAIFLYSSKIPTDSCRWLNALLLRYTTNGFTKKYHPKNELFYHERKFSFSTEVHQTQTLSSYMYWECQVWFWAKLSHKQKKIVFVCAQPQFDENFT